MRLAKHLAHAGVASRRAAEQLIFDGRVTVGGEVVRDPARDVDGSEADRGRRPAGRRRRAGRARSTSSTSPPASSRPRTTPTAAAPSSTSSRPTAASTRSGASTPTRTGLILLTDDGELAHRLTHPSFEVPKTYRAVVRNPPVREPALRKLREGVELDDGRTSPAKVRRISSERARDHHPRGPQAPGAAHVEAVGHRVETLERVAFGPLRLGNLPRRRAPPPDGRAEVERLRALIECRAPCASTPSAAPPRDRERRRRHPRRHRRADARDPRAQRSSPPRTSCPASSR